MKDYPNREALRKAHDIYRDVMRLFIVRCLKRVRGERVEDLIENSLDGWEKKQFKQDLQRYESPEASIDIDHFPKIIKRCWSRDRAFRQEFDSNSKIQYKTGTIVESRNFWAHPGLDDVELAHTQANLTLVAEVLGEIKNQNAKQAVETIRDQLFATEPEKHPLETENAAYKEQIADVTKQLDIAKAEKTELEKHLKTVSDRLKDLEKENAAYQKHIETITDQSATPKVVNTQLEEHRETTPPPEFPYTGSQLRDFRKKAGLTQETVAVELGMKRSSSAAIGDWEAERVKVPRKHYTKLKELYGL